MLEALLDRRVEEHKRGFLMAGIVAAAVYNSNPFREKGAKVFEAVDFVPGYQKRDAVQGPREQAVMLRAIFKA